jgi:hypothetical protein
METQIFTRQSGLETHPFQGDIRACARTRAVAT